MKSYENLTTKSGGRYSIVVNRKFILMMILIIAIFSSCKQNTQPDEPNKESQYEITVQLDSLLETESIFKLKTLFMRKSELLCKVDSIYYGAWIDYISNKPEDALEKANTYLIEVQHLAGNADEKIIQTHILKLNIYRDNYAYQKGLNEVNYILN